MNDTTGQTSSCCGHTPHSPVEPEGRPNLMGATEDDMATCPVMEGRPVVKSTAEAAGLFRDYEGTRYWLCCAGCGPLFDADPQKYAAA